MVLSEAAAEARLQILRSQRDVIDGEIRDLTLYLELGRRLAAGDSLSHDDAPQPRQEIASRSREGIGRQGYSDYSFYGSDPVHDPVEGRGLHAEAEAEAPFPRTPQAGGRHSGLHAAQPPLRQREAPTGPASLLARRRGRALIEAVLSILGEAGRPLHARELHEALAAGGLTLPGRDPVAALNTRLWKRAKRGGPLRRLGDAVYALSEENVAARTDRE